MIILKLKNIRTILIMLLIVFPFGFLLAQDFNNYTNLKPEGPIPDDILIPSSAKFEEQKDELAKVGSKRERKSKKDFLLQSNFVLDEYLKSGKINFNDDVTKYANRIKDYILRDMPEVQEKVRIYHVLSPVVNAFATNDGIILLHTGLVAKLTSEAQLAFVLCHEFQHYIEQHPINKYVKTDQLRSDLKELSAGNMEEFLLASNHFSRELELEADRLGVKLYERSNYSLDEPMKVLDMLRVAHMPYDNMEFRTEFFEDEDLVFPPSYSLDSVSEIDTEEDYEDEHSTHPNIMKRKTAIGEYLDGKSNEGRSEFIFGQEEFERIRKICRYEMSFQHLAKKEYERSIYNSYMLLQENPGSRYLETIIAKALYGLSKYRNEREFYSVHEDYEDLEGEYQQLCFFLEEMNKEELHILSMKYCWQIRNKYPQDHALVEISDDLMEELFQKYRKEAENLSKDIVPAGYFDSLFTTKVEYDSIDGDVEELIIEYDPDDDDSDKFYKYVFSKFFSNNEFSVLFDSLAAHDVDRENDIEDEFVNIEKSKRKRVLRPRKLGIEKMVVITPIYREVDARKQMPYKYIQSEKGLTTFNYYLEESASKTGIDLNVLTNNDLSENDVEKFNDLTIFTNWVTDFFSSNLDVGMSNIYKAEAVALAEKYGTPYFCWTGCLTLKDHYEKWKWGIVIPGSIYLYPMAPILIYKLLKPKNATLYFNFVFDLKEGKMINFEYRDMNYKGTSNLLRSTIYNTMFYLAAKEK